MDRFCIISNNFKSNTASVRESIVEYLFKNGKTVAIADVSLDSSEDCFTDIGSIPTYTECIIILGGDGTFLHAASDLKNLDIPLFGINMGTLGFLAEREQNNFESALDQLINDEYTIEHRMMISAKVFKRDVHNDMMPTLIGTGNGIDDGNDDGYGKGIHGSLCALNDIVIARSGFSRLINMHVYINDRFVNDYRADGLIISTPTGSTGYNLSAGGPVVAPKTELMIVTPICPHSLYARSIVVSSDDVVTIKVYPGKKTQAEEAIVTVDGNDSMRLKAGDYIEVGKSTYYTRLVKLDDMSFFDILRMKLTPSV